MKKNVHKKTGREICHFGNPAVFVRPVGFPPHPHGWFGFIVNYLLRKWAQKNRGKYQLDIRHPGCLNETL